MRDADRFEAHRPRLEAAAYRMLGSHHDAEDVVQEAWLRLHRQDLHSVENLGGWLTTVVARICLDKLRSRQTRPEQPLSADPFGSEPDPQDVATLADSVGMALLVVLDTLSPAERLAFVLHDTFGVPFADIAPIVGRSEDATKMLASRARRRVRDVAGPPAGGARHREVVAAFLAASQRGDFEALLTLLDPDVAVRADIGPGGLPTQVGGAGEVARQALMFSAQAPYARLALLDSSVAIAVVRGERVVTVMTFAIVDDVIAAIEVIADPSRLQLLNLQWT